MISIYIFLMSYEDFISQQSSGVQYPKKKKVVVQCNDNIIYFLIRASRPRLKIYSAKFVLHDRQREAG